MKEVLTDHKHPAALKLLNSNDNNLTAFIKQSTNHLRAKSNLTSTPKSHTLDLKSTVKKR